MNDSNSINNSKENTPLCSGTGSNVSTIKPTQLSFSSPADASPVPRKVLFSTNTPSRAVTLMQDTSSMSDHQLTSLLENITLGEKGFSFASPENVLPLPRFSKDCESSPKKSFPVKESSIPSLQKSKENSSQKKHRVTLDCLTTCTEWKLHLKAEGCENEKSHTVTNKAHMDQSGTMMSLLERVEMADTETFTPLMQSIVKDALNARNADSK